MGIELHSLRSSSNTEWIACWDGGETHGRVESADELLYSARLHCYNIPVKRGSGKSIDRRKKGISNDKAKSVCINKECKLRKKGCKGFEGCPGYMGR